MPKGTINPRKKTAAKPAATVTLEAKPSGKPVDTNWANTAGDTEAEEDEEKDPLDEDEEEADTSILGSPEDEEEAEAEVEAEAEDDETESADEDADELVQMTGKLTKLEAESGTYTQLIDGVRKARKIVLNGKLPFLREAELLDTFTQLITKICHAQEETERQISKVGDDDGEESHGAGTTASA